MAARRPRVLVTRSPHQSSELAGRLRALGLEPVLIPTIQLTEPTSFAALDAALAHLDRFHWLLFTSANAVEAFHRRSLESPQVRVPQPALSVVEWVSTLRRGNGSPRIAAIGPSTARSLEATGLTIDLVPPQAVAESFVQALLPHVRQPDGSPTRFLLIRAEEAREHLPEALRAAGAEVTIAPAYRTVVPEESIPAIRALFTRSNEPRLRVPHVSQRHEIEPPHAITFTSSSSVRNLLALCEAAGVALPTEALRVSIGPITSQTLRDAGCPPHAEAPEATVAALAAMVAEVLRKLADL